jgi:hypothetical protein
MILILTLPGPRMILILILTAILADCNEISISQKILAGGVSGAYCWEVNRDVHEFLSFPQNDFDSHSHCLETNSSNCLCFRFD